MAALPLTCDLVNPYHERKEQKEKKKRSIKRDYVREVEEQSQAGSGEKQSNPHATQEKERRKITVFSSVVLRERKSNNNTGSLLLSPLNSFLCAKIKRQQ